MALTRGPGYAAEAALSVPAGMAVDTLFLLALVAFLPLGLVPALAAGLLAWFASAALVLSLPPLSPLGAILLYAIVTAASFSVADLILKVRAVPKKPVPFRPATVLVRAVFAGAIVSGAVAAAQYAPPYLTGIVSVFPAVLLSTMTILARAQGRDFARATGKVLILSSSNIIVYALLVALLFPVVGPWWGSLCAFAAAVAYVAVLMPASRRIR